MEKKQLSGRSILVVESDIRDALDLQDSFAEAGARVFTAYRLVCALAHAQRTSLSAAVIDVSGGVRHSAALCRHLTEREVPFIFYGKQVSAGLEEWSNVPFVTKPDDLHSTVDIVAGLLNLNAPQPDVSILSTSTAPVSAGIHLG